jgi:transaldolase
MKLFLDTADIEEIRTVNSWGVLDGVTTNPTLFGKVKGMTYDEVLQLICGITKGPVSAEVVADDVEGMLKEGRHFAKLADNIYVKVPMSENGLAAMARFKAEGIKTNCTLIFSANQGLLAAKAGASLLSPFVGRLDDINEEGMTVIRELVEIVTIHELETEVLTASVRHPRHVTDAALAGSHIATLPFKVFQQMVRHPLTDKGIVQFKSDWEAARAAATASAKAYPGTSRRSTAAVPRGRRGSARPHASRCGAGGHRERSRRDACVGCGDLSPLLRRAPVRERRAVRRRARSAAPRRRDVLHPRG